LEVSLTHILLYSRGDRKLYVLDYKRQIAEREYGDRRRLEEYLVHVPTLTHDNWTPAVSGFGTVVTLPTSTTTTKDQCATVIRYETNFVNSVLPKKEEIAGNPAPKRQLDVSLKSLALSLCLQLYFHTSLEDVLFVLDCSLCCKNLREYLLNWDESFWLRLLRQHLGEISASYLLSREKSQLNWKVFVKRVLGRMRPYCIAGQSIEKQEGKLDFNFAFDENFTFSAIIPDSAFTCVIIFCFSSSSLRL
jgi:hypothetical protein